MTTHAEWLESNLKIKLSPFGTKVANILGVTWRGLYHLNHTSYDHERTNWLAEDFIEVVILGELATWDGNELTQLVVLCHEECIRLAIKGSSNNYLKLCFQQRNPNTDMTIYEGHPTLDEQIKSISKGYK